MKIVIDGRFWGPGHTGLGVYTQNLVENLLKIDPQNKYVVIKNGIRPYTLLEQIIMPLLLYKEMPNLVHFPSINVPILYFGKFVVTVHDLIKHDSRGPETSTHNPALYWLKYYLYHLVFWWAVHKSCQILVPSNDVKAKIISHYQIDPKKIIVTYEAAVLKPTSSDKYPRLPERFAVYTGNAYPHKNLNRLISIWPKIYAATKTKLIIICGRSVFTSHIENLIKNETSIQFLGYVPNEQLVAIYPYARAYVFPSLAEGFGIPGLDAMNFSLPVVCSDIPVLHEIYGPGARYFDPKDEKDMAEKIIQVLTNQKLREQLIRSGKTQVKKYSWVKTAKETLKVYENVLSFRTERSEDPKSIK